MRLRLFATTAFLIILAGVAEAAVPPFELELATERGVQITAPHEWLQLLAGIGIDHVRIRGSQPGDEPRVENRGSSPGAGYRVVGVLTSRDQLRLPGGTFSRADRARLKEYFARLAADGVDSAIAPRVRFGLTQKELNAVLADLAQPVDFATKRQAPRAVINRLHTKLSLKFAVEAEADRILRAAPSIPDELSGLTAGTSMAMMLRNCGLVMRPEKLRGQPVDYRIAPTGAETTAQSTRGNTAATDMQFWPIGWEPDKSPGETAPSLLESLNAEIDGYTLDEALAAIGPRLKVPMYVDHAALKACNIDPAKIQVKLARTRTSYKRVIDRILAQALLGSEIRVDEAGMPFLWITR